MLYRPPTWPFSGSERRFVCMTKNLKEYGVEFDAIEPYPPLSWFMSVYHNSHCIRFFSRGRIYIDLFEWITLGLKEAKKLCQKNKYDFIYATNNNLYNFLLGFFVSRLFSLPLVVVAHHLRWVDPLDPIRSSKPLPFSNYKKMRKNKLSRLDALVQAFGAIIESQIRRAELCITVSEAIAENLRALGICEKKIAVTGNAIDFDCINSFPNYEKRYDAVFVGRLDMGKGIVDLIKVWKQVIRTLPNAELVVIGTGFLRETAIKLTKELGLENKIKFIGSVTDQNLYRTLDASKIFVLPSRMEGWSIATAEALARGLPAVCYDIPAIREIYGDGQSVFLVPTGDIKAFAERIIYLLSLKQADYAVLKHTSQHYSRRFDWRNIALKEYRALVKAVDN